MGGVERPAVDVAAVHYAVAELLCGSDLMARGTEAADVGVDIRTVAGQRDDMVGHRRWSEDALGVAVATQRLCRQAALSLRYTAATTKTIGLRLPVSESPVD
jgi:hypothetical protein